MFDVSQEGYTQGYDDALNNKPRDPKEAWQAFREREQSSLDSHTKKLYMKKYNEGYSSEECSMNWNENNSDDDW
jgi:hypothetical protein